MHLKIVGISFLLLLAACSGAQDSANNALDAAGNETGASYNKVREMLGMQTKKPPKQASVQPRYCYRTFEDIVCYSRPQPGNESRLVAYQNTRGGTGYVIEPAPLPDDTDAKPLPPLKSVNVNPPPEAKADPKLKEVIFDPADLEPKALVPDKDE